MAENRLAGKKVAVIATDGFEQAELLKPMEALEAEGAEVEILSVHEGKIRGWVDGDWADEISVTKTVENAAFTDYEALVLPGGVMNPDTLRTHDEVIAFVKNFYESGRPIAAICHGPWTLIEAGILGGHTVTSWPSLHTDLVNAGAHWVDSPVISDRGLVTSRKPEDLPAFNQALIEAILEKQKAGLTTAPPQSSSIEFADSVSG